MATEPNGYFVLRIGSRDYTLVGREVVLIALGAFAILGATVAMVAFEYLAFMHSEVAKDVVPAIIAIATPLLTAIYVSIKSLTDSMAKRRSDKEALEADSERESSTIQLGVDLRRAEQEKDKR